MKTGDRVFIYHSMGDAAIVGVADVVADGRPDPNNPKLAVADFRFRCRIEPPVTLREIKAIGSVRRLGAGAPKPPFHHGGA